MSTLHENMAKVVARRQEQIPAAVARYRECSRRRLEKIIQKKFRTTFVGDIARFENFFGSLWGHGKSEEECTPKQLVYREIWERCRTEILNHGNHQSRAVIQELQQYDVNWNRYQTVMSPLKKEGKNDEQQKDV